MSQTRSMSMKALVIQPGQQDAKIENKPIPGTLKPNEVLFKVIAVGSNPTDWKHLYEFGKPGCISGCDFVGIATELGSSVPKEVKGQLRAGFVRGGMDKENGAFAEYVKQAWDVTWMVPKNISPQQAASAPIPLATVAQAFYLRLGFPMPMRAPDANMRNKWILIWSGATSVGQYAIQLAKLTGLRIATTASPNKHALVKSLGAEVVFNYRDPDVAKKLKEATSDGIVYGLDTITDHGSTQIIQQAFSARGGQLIVLLPHFGQVHRPEVKTSCTLGYTANGQDNEFDGVTFKASKEDRENYVECCKMFTKLFEEGKIRPLEVTDMGGLETVKKGMDMVKNGTNPTKLVHTIAKA